MDTFSKLKEQYPEQEEFQILYAAAASSWTKLEEYYNMANESAAYYAANVLRPGEKWKFFYKKWKGDAEKMEWLEGDGKRQYNIRQLVQDLWEEEYKGKYLSPTSSKPDDSQKPGKGLQYDTFGGLRMFENIDESDDDDVDDIDHYTAYCSTNREKTDPLQYWNARYISQPDLARFALDMLAIPMMSAECERVFSSAKHLITDARNRLNPDIIEANECLKAWFDEPKPGDFDDDVIMRDQDGDNSDEEPIGPKAMLEAIDSHDSEADDDDNIKIVDGEVELIDD